MKKTLFTLFIGLFVLTSIGQNCQKPCIDDSPVSFNKSKVVNLKASGDVLWEEDFDAAEWSQYSGGMKPGWRTIDNNGEDFIWIWAQHGPRGRWTSPENDASTYVPKDQQTGDTVIINFFKNIPGNTVSNGFVMLESDYYNTAPSGDEVPDDNIIRMDSYIQIDHIDLSSTEGAILKLNQLARTCCRTLSGMDVLVSWDWEEGNDFAHWIYYDVRGEDFLVNSNTHIDDRQLEIDISAAVVGQSNVTIRFQQNRISHYFWVIDDIQIVEKNKNDIIVNNAWWDYGKEYDYSSVNYDPENHFFGGYAMIPEGQVDYFVAFRAAIQNTGIDAQTNVQYNIAITKDNIEVYNESSGGITIE